MGVFFNGKYLVTPTAETAIDDSRMYPVSTASGNNLVIMGSGLGGKPKELIPIASPLRAKRLLRGGELYEGVLRAFYPSPDTGSPLHVYAMRVDSATAAALTLKDANAADTVELTATDYGAHTNDIEIKIEDGTSLGAKVSVRSLGTVTVKDDIGAEPFTIEYVGAEASAEVNIAAGVMSLEAPVGTVVRTLQLNAYSSVAALCEAIESSADWDCVVSSAFSRFDPVNLDGVDAGDPKTAPLQVTGHLYEFVKHIQSVDELLLDAEALVTNGLRPANIAYTQLAGGTNGNAATQDWEDALAAMHEEDVQWIVPLTATSAIWDLVAAHCFTMSDNKRERRAFVGGATGDTAAVAIQRAAGLNTDLVSYVYPGIYQKNPTTRRPELLPAYMAAVNVAAGFASMNPGETMSRKPITATGAEVKLSEPIDTDELIENGVLALVQSPEGVIVSKAVTTWQLDNRYNRVEVGVGAAVDYIARTVREGLKIFLGKRGSPIIVESAKTRTELLLDELARDPAQGGVGVIVGDDNNPAYRNVKVTLQGDVLYVSFECQPVLPINYVLINIGIEPYTTTIE